MQEIVVAEALYRAMEAGVFTSGPDCTRAAQELAQANGVKLRGPGELLRPQQLAMQRQIAPRELLPA